MSSTFLAAATQRAVDAATQVPDDSMSEGPSLSVLSDDVVRVIGTELCYDPLRPILAVNFSSSDKQMREAMADQLAELKQSYQHVVELASTVAGMNHGNNQ